MKTKGIIMIAGVVVIIGALFIFARYSAPQGSEPVALSKDIPGDKSVVKQDNWLNTELSDVISGEKFKISDFKGKPVLLESFAVWCPTCLKQQKEIKKIAEEKGDEIIHISLDTDPNEDASKVLDHAARNDFDWYFAVPPIEMTRELTKVFGLTFVNAPSAPVVLICEDQTYRLLKNGVKKSGKLLDEIERGCAI